MLLAIVSYINNTSPISNQPNNIVISEKKVNKFDASIDESNPIVHTKNNEVIKTTPNPIANYVQYKLFAHDLLVSGQIPIQNGKIDPKYTGPINISNINNGIAGAKLATENLLNQIKKALNGNLDRIIGVKRITIYVNAGDSFHKEHLVADGASNTIINALGKNIGTHTRVAIGVSDLPMNASVEVSGEFAIK